mmetsp:Transcript_14567/g.26766  ORF Transcript_14567/g.26766 Transcript_14567/m.26766 type:complete len:200 (+) Transcript_14567:1072-1671(+)
MSVTDDSSVVSMRLIRTHRLPVNLPSCMAGSGPASSDTTTVPLGMVPTTLEAKDGAVLTRHLPSQRTLNLRSGAVAVCFISCAVTCVTMDIAVAARLPGHRSNPCARLSFFSSPPGLLLCCSATGCACCSLGAALAGGGAPCCSPACALLASDTSAVVRSTLSWWTTPFAASMALGYAITGSAFGCGDALAAVTGCGDG